MQPPFGVFLYARKVFTGENRCAVFAQKNT